MEFGLDQLRTGLRPGSSYIDMSSRDSSNLLEPASHTGSNSKPNSITLFWSQTGPRLVADLLQTC